MKANLFIEIEPQKREWTWTKTTKKEILLSLHLIKKYLFPLRSVDEAYRIIRNEHFDFNSPIWSNFLTKREK